MDLPFAMFIHEKAKSREEYIVETFNIALDQIQFLSVFTLSTNKQDMQWEARVKIMRLKIS